MENHGREPKVKTIGMLAMDGLELHQQPTPHSMISDALHVLSREQPNPRNKGTRKASCLKIKEGYQNVLGTYEPSKVPLFFSILDVFGKCFLKALIIFVHFKIFIYTLNMAIWM